MYLYADQLSSCFHAVLKAVVSDQFRSAYMQLLDPNHVPWAIRNNPKFYPYFKDRRGAMDGSKFAASPPSELKARFRDRDGNLTWNVLSVCDFDLNFIYCLVG